MLARVRYAAVAGDSSVKDDVLVCLSSKHPTIQLTGMHAAAILALPEADAKLQEICSTSKDDFAPIYARVYLARLRAEAAAQGLSSESSKDAARMSTFLAELKLTPGSINSAVASYAAAGAKQRIPPVEILALRQIADMAYRGDYSAYSEIPDFAALQFGPDDWSSLVVRFAAVPKATRLEALADYIAKSAIWGADAPLAAQLLADAGDSGCQAAADKLKAMISDGQTYPINGWEGLMRVLEARQATAFEPVLKEVAANGPKDAAWEAQLYSRRLTRGYRSVMEHGL